MLPLVRGGVGVCIPLGEVDCGCLAKSLPHLCEVVFVLPRWRLYWLREEFGTPSGLEILHGGEGGDVELGARTSEHIFVFAFDPLTLSNSLSFILCLASFILSYHILYAWLVWVCLTCA